MGAAESVPYLAEEKVDPTCQAAAELARQMVKGEVKVIPRTEVTLRPKEEEQPVPAVTPIEVEIGKVVVIAAEQIARAWGGGFTGALTRLLGDDVFMTTVRHSPLNPLTLGDICKLVEQQLDQSTMDRINGMLHDITDALSINYADYKKDSDLTDPTNRQRLHAYLMTLDEHLMGEIGTLMQDHHGKVGLSCFLLLAGLRLALYQEMAVVDPANTDPDLRLAGSRYAEPQHGIVALYAREYAEHVEKLWLLIVQDRKNQLFRYTTNFMGFWCHHWFDDRATGKVGVKWDDETFKEYEDDVVEKLNKRYCYPFEIAADWRKLINTPVNISVEEESADEDFEIIDMPDKMKIE